MAVSSQIIIAGSLAAAWVSGSKSPLPMVRNSWFCRYIKAGDCTLSSDVAKWVCQNQVSFSLRGWAVVPIRANHHSWRLRNSRRALAGDGLALLHRQVLRTEPLDGCERGRRSGVGRIRAGEVQELLHRGAVALRGGGVDLGRGRAEPGAPQQVGDRRAVISGHDPSKNGRC